MENVCLYTVCIYIYICIRTQYRHIYMEHIRTYLDMMMAEYERARTQSHIFLSCARDVHKKIQVIRADQGHTTGSREDYMYIKIERRDC